MKDDVQITIFRTLIVFVFVIALWIGFLFLNACGFTLTCKRGAALVDRTPVPTLIPATLPVQPRFIPTAVASPTVAGTETEGVSAEEIARPSNAGGPGEAVDLTGNAAEGEKIFVTNCVVCHGAKGVGGIPNPGSGDGTVPELNPIDSTIKDKEYKTFATNIDLFIQHGSTPEGASPIFHMPAWGDTNGLTQQQIADVVAYVISLNP